MTTVNVSISVQGLDKALKRIEEFKSGLQDKCQELAKRLGEIGVQVAQTHYKSAPYAGVNDVEVWLDESGDKGTVTIIAGGEAVLFIEFGTGITMPDSMEARAELKSGGVVGHGQYGDKRGSSPKGWYYPIEKGVGENPPLGTEVSNKPGMEHLIHTYGNPAYPAMYLARKEIIENVQSIAREVFNL